MRDMKDQFKNQVFIFEQVLPLTTPTKPKLGAKTVSCGFGAMNCGHGNGFQYLVHVGNLGVSLITPTTVESLEVSLVKAWINTKKLRSAVVSFRGRLSE